MTPRQNAATRRASTAKPMAAAMQHASTIDLSKSLFIRVLYAMLRAGEGPPGATVTFVPARGAATISRRQSFHLSNFDSCIYHFC